MSVDHCLRLLTAIITNPELNESARKETFVSYLRAIFPDRRHQNRFDALTSGAEDHVKVAGKASPGFGFIDTHLGKLLIEFKRDLGAPSEREKAIKQLKRYTAAVWTNSGVDASFCCVSTDVLRWHIWRPIPNASPSMDAFTEEMVELELVEEFDASDADKVAAEHLYLLLRRLLIDINLLQLTAANLRRDFGFRSAQYAMLQPTLEGIVAEAKEEAGVRLALRQWRKYQNYNARSTVSIDDTLYTKHLYLVILARLMVAACFTEQKRTGVRVDDQTIQAILNGAYFRSNLRLANLVEHDLFGWITKDQWLESFIPLSRTLFHYLRSYDFSNVQTENILRLIYEEMMPEHQRDLLGQRTTPEFLAREIISEIFGGAPEGFRYLDPACGSGTFVRAALLEILGKSSFQELSRQDQLSRLINAVTGIDVDPVAVLLAKAEWALTLFDVLTTSSQLVDIPIYHADSLFLPSSMIQTDYGLPFAAKAEVGFDDISLPVPAALLKNTQAFDRLVNWCQQKALLLADVDEDVAEVDYKTVVRNIRGILGGALLAQDSAVEEGIAKFAAALAREFASRISEGRNGIWAFIVRNHMRPTLFAGRFNLIASNPPWLTISRFEQTNIPYREQLEARAEYFDIKPSRSAFLHTEIATTFALHTVAHFLGSEDSRAAFVMPRSVFNGDHHHKFRLANYKERVAFTLTEIWDMEDVDELFEIPSCVLFGKKVTQSANHTVQQTIPVRYCTGNGQSFTIGGYGSIKLLTYGNKSAWVEAGSEATLLHSRDYYKQRFKQGADLMPRALFFVDLVNPHPSQSVVAIETSAIERANPYQKRFKGEVFQGNVNRRYLFTTVTSNHLLPFIILYRELPTVVLPVEFKGSSPRIVSTDEMVDRGNISTAKYFAHIQGRAREELSDTKSIGERIDFRNKLTRQRFSEFRYLVHTGASGSIPCAAFHETNLDPDRQLIADQTTHIYPTDDENEAYYLTGVLNSSILADAIYDFQSKGSFGPRHIHDLSYDAIPKFDQRNELHQRIVERSRQATGAAEEALTAQMSDVTRPVSHRRRALRKELKPHIDSLGELVKHLLAT